MSRDLMDPSLSAKVRHAVHIRWNRSRWNPDYEPFASDCLCCCALCEDRQMLSSVWHAITAALRRIKVG